MMKNLTNIFFFLGLCLTLFLSGCNQNDKSKSSLIGEVVIQEEIDKLFGYTPESVVQIDKLLDIYESTDDPKILIAILEEINELFSEYSYLKEALEEGELSEEQQKTFIIQKKIVSNQRLLSLYQKVAESNDRLLSPIALYGFLALEGGRYSEKWQDWSWGKRTEKLLHQAVNGSFYKLANFHVTELLAIAEHYPESLYTKACREYVAFTEDPYFDINSSRLNSFEQQNTYTNKPIFKQPFNPARELEFWPQFLQKYPEHTGTDDAMYRMARAYEIKGDYESAILWYYKASLAPDGDKGYFARQRALFIIDLLMSSDSLKKILSNNSDSPLVPYIIYSKAIHLLREGNYQLAISELEEFENVYKDSGLTSFWGETNLDELDFWDDLRQQITDIKELVSKIDTKNENFSASQISRERDKSLLYYQARFWFHNDSVTNNHLWRGELRNAISRFTPAKYQGNKTLRQMSITYDFLEKVEKGFQAQNNYLISINLFQQFLKQYPESELSEDAKYSIAMAYYSLEAEYFPVFPTQKNTWQDVAVDSFYNFVSQYTDSSKSDDALFLIAKMTSFSSERGNQVIALQSLSRLLNDYPEGDHKNEAQKLLEEMISTIPPKERLLIPEMGIAINTKEEYSGIGIVVLDVLHDSPSGQAGLRPGDIILQASGKNLTKLDDLTKIISRRQSGKTLAFEIQREGQKQIVQVAIK